MPVFTREEVDLALDLFHRLNSGGLPLSTIKRISTGKIPTHRVVQAIESLDTVVVTHPGVPISIHKSGLERPLRDILIRAGYTTIQELSRARQSEVIMLRGMGQKRIDLVKDMLSAYGLKFREEESL